MWPFRRKQRLVASGSLRVGEPSDSPVDYAVFTVSESRHPEAFEHVWSHATDTERDEGVARRWATLVPLHDPAFGVAEVAVEFDGLRACYLRPPHLGLVAARAAAEKVAVLEVPALIVRGPAGPTVTLLIPDAG